MLFLRSTVSSLCIGALLAAIPLVSALRDSDIPNECRDSCQSTVSLLNGCGLETDGSNMDESRRQCWCPNMDHGGYDRWATPPFLRLTCALTNYPVHHCSCTACIRNHRDDNGNGDDDQQDYRNDNNNGDDDDDNDNDQRKRSIRRRDLLGNLLNLGDTFCLVNGGELRQLIEQLFWA